ncbi:MAG: hypothetical protein U7123_09910 [Potamolinea sp.]
MKKTMIVSDLNYLECLSEETSNLAGGFAYVDVGAFASAFGVNTFTSAISDSVAVSTPYTGSLALGYSQAIAIAYTPPSGGNFPW